MTSKTIQETTPNVFSSQEIVTSFGTSETMQTSFTSFETNIYKNSYYTSVSSAHMASSAVSTVTTLSDKPYLPTLKLEAIGGNKDTFEICNHAGVMTTYMEGYITSPGYGAGLSYDLNLRCKLRLTTKPDNVSICRFFVIFVIIFIHRRFCFFTNRICVQTEYM